MTTTTDFGRTVTLTDGDDVYAVPFDNSLVNLIYGLAGNDMITGGQAGGTIYGGDGDDTLISGNQDAILVGGLGANTYRGGIAALNGNARDFTYYDAGTAGTYLYADNGSGDQHLFVQTVVFADGTTVAENRLGQYVTSVGAAGMSVLTAEDVSDARYEGGIGTGDTLIVPGNVGDYTLSRATHYGDRDFVTDTGDFILQGEDTHGIDIGQAIDTVQFQNGQYLALADLPSYVAGTAALPFGGGDNDLLFQTQPSGYEFFDGGAGSDTVYLKGNITDYAIRSVDAYASDYASSFNGGSFDTHLSGALLIGLNGSGELVIDSSVETVHFQNGDTLAFADLFARLAPDTSGNTDTLHLLPAVAAATATAELVDGTAGIDRLLLNGTVDDYTLSRDGGGDFVLDPGSRPGLGGLPIDVEQSVETIQFGNGQYLSLHDVPFYVAGDATFTNGSPFDDLLFAGAGGDQYVSGGDGVDNLFIHGNVADYTLAPAMTDATANRPAIDGYELIAANGSGNLYVDQSTETVHFQNGQYLAFQDLPAYIHPAADLMG